MNTAYTLILVLWSGGDITYTPIGDGGFSADDCISYSAILMLEQKGSQYICVAE